MHPPAPPPTPSPPVSPLNYPICHSLSPHPCPYPPSHASAYPPSQPSVYSPIQSSPTSLTSLLRSSLQPLSLPPSNHTPLHLLINPPLPATHPQSTPPPPAHSLSTCHPLSAHPPTLMTTHLPFIYSPAHPSAFPHRSACGRPSIRPVPPSAEYAWGA